MDIAYFKRIRMEIDLAGRELTPASVPDRYSFIPWEDSLLDAFARAKYLGFRNEIDTGVFPCLADFDGCRRLMAEIAGKPGFLPEATWLVVCRPGVRKGTEEVFGENSPAIQYLAPKTSSVPGCLRPVNGRGRLVYCGTVQGVRDQYGCGAIQNLGVAHEHRRCGLGMALLLRALGGFHRAGVRRVFLEVTAQNQSAVRLYRRAGFFAKRIVYKTVETASAM
jgi:ribosomal protein S18 acetylase RimI-like enzyme